MSDPKKMSFQKTFTISAVSLQNENRGAKIRQFNSNQFSQPPPQVRSSNLITVPIQDSSNSGNSDYWTSSGPPKVPLHQPPPNYYASNQQGHGQGGGGHHGHGHHHQSSQHHHHHYQQQQVQSGSYHHDWNSRTSSGYRR